MMEFTFEKSPFELALEALQPGGVMTALRFLSLTEDMDEESVEDAFAQLEEGYITLDISDLPANTGSGKMALRLRQEQQIVKQGNLLAGLLVQHLGEGAAFLASAGVCAAAPVVFALKTAGRADDLGC